LYFSPSWRLHLLGFVVRRIGEPLRSKFTPDKMVGLLAAHRFEVTEDRAVSEIGRSLSPELERATRPFKHARVVVADKRGGTRTVVGLRVRAASGCASRPSQPGYPIWRILSLRFGPLAGESRAPACSILESLALQRDEHGSPRPCEGAKCVPRERAAAV
jgi:hypothetical protein